MDVLGTGDIELGRASRPEAIDWTYDQNSVPCRLHTLARPHRSQEWALCFFRPDQPKPSGLTWERVGNAPAVSQII